MMIKFLKNYGVYIIEFIAFLMIYLLGWFILVIFG